MGILNKTLPPPPAPTELTPEQIETKRRLDDARNRLGKLSPQLIEDVRLVCNAAVDDIAMADYCDPVTGKSFGVPFEVVRRGVVGRAHSCPCAAYMLNAERVK